MLLRTAAREDLEAIVAVHMESWDAAKEGLDLDTRPSVASRSERWSALLGDPGVTVVVACDPGVVGFIAYGPSRDEDRIGQTEVYVMYVAPAAWRRGIGTALMATLPASMDPVSLWVAEGNSRARAFYAACGFADDGAREPGHHVPAMRMARSH